MARSFDITVYRGEDVDIPFLVRTADDDDTPLDITGRTIVFTVAEKPESTVKLLQKTCTHTDEAGGACTATIPATELLEIAGGVYYADIWITDTGSGRMLGYGRFTVRKAARVPTS